MTFLSSSGVHFVASGAKVSKRFAHENLISHIPVSLCCNQNL